MFSAQTISSLRARAWKAAPRPSVADAFFAALLAALLCQGGLAHALLADGDTGWHIRTGELVLAAGSVPAQDVFSFSRPGEPWFAWEWLTDVLFALLYRWHGLSGVVACTVIVLAGAATALFCGMIRRGAGLWTACAASLAAVSASMVHFLARPHVFSVLLLALGLWALEEDRRRPSPAVWVLVPMSALWANLHAGFVAWLVVLGWLAATGKWETGRANPRRYAVLGGLCAVATLANPYGWSLHAHVARYLASPWILENVQEFQAPRFRSESALVFALLLLAGVMLAQRALEGRRWFEGGLVLLWGLAALRSARHVPLYAVVAAPLIACEFESLWACRVKREPARSWLRITWEAGRQIAAPACRPTFWSAAALLLVLCLGVPGPQVHDFAESRFPVQAVAHNLRQFTAAAVPPRILTSDQWGDYLIFRLYPRQRVFFDGRSDFYGPQLGGDYQALLSATGRWREALDRHRFDLALLPHDWPLTAVFEGDPQWREVYRDSVAVLFEHRKQTASGKG